MREAANYASAHIAWPRTAHNLGHNLLSHNLELTACSRKLGGAERLYTFCVQASPLPSKHQLCARVHVCKYRAVVQTLDWATLGSIAPQLAFASSVDQKTVAAAVGLS